MPMAQICNPFGVPTDFIFAFDKSEKKKPTNRLDEAAGGQTGFSFESPKSIFGSKLRIKSAGIE
jgi:hypothetical protein